MSEISDALGAGQAALKNADWAAAQRLFEICANTEDSPEAQDGLGIALWWLNDIRESHRRRTLAYITYRQRGDFQQAARIAAWIAREQVFLNSNANAMRGWFARAERLLKDNHHSPAYGWFSLLRASMLSTSEELINTAAEVISLAQEFQENNLEALAIAFLGTAQVTTGQVARGMANLDEAMAAAYTGDLDYMTVSEIFCLMLSACQLAGDLGRTEHWCLAAGEFAQEHHCPFLSAYCRTTYGALLTETGNWQKAETALTEAIQLFDAGHQGLRVHAILRLADLRVYQGKLEEAEVLLSGYEDNQEAALPLARLYLARKEPRLAKAVIEQALPAGKPATLDQAPLLRLLVECWVADGDTDNAAQAADQLAGLADQSQSDLLHAQAALALGQIKLHLGDEHAIECFEKALAYLQAQEQSILASRARLAMARLVQKEDPAAAITWAKAALASFQRSGAAHEAEEAAQLLRSLGERTSHPAHALYTLSTRENEVYGLVNLGLTNREIAERLVLSEKTVEHHVTSILTKLGVRSRSEAIALAVKEGANREQPLPG